MDRLEESRARAEEWWLQQTNIPYNVATNAGDKSVDCQL